MEQNTGVEVAQVEQETQEQGQQQETVADPAVVAKEGSLKQAVKEQVRRFKLKINGREREVDEKTLVAMAQKNESADEKFQKSSAKQKRIQQLMSMAKKDPDLFIKEMLGEDAVEYSKKRLARELEQLSLDPKDKQLRDAKRKLEAYQQKEKARQEQIQKKADEKAVQHWTKHYDKVLPEAITAAGLPLTEDVIRHATDIMIANLEQGFDLPLEAVMELTKDRYIGSFKKFLSSADRSKLAQLLGDDAQKLGVSVKKAPVPKKQSVQVGSQGPKKPKSERESMEQLEKRLKEWANS